jgi:ABC-2 type transport system permease protein
VSRYWAIFHARFRSLLQYRAAALAGVATQTFWGLIRMMIFTAFYESASGPMPMGLDEVISYVWLSQALLLLIPFRTDGELAEMVRSGAVAYELLRPADLYNLWAARSLAARTAPTLLRCLPQIVFATAMGWLMWDHPMGIVAAVAALVGAIALSTAVTMLLNISMFWTLNAGGVNAIFSAMMFLFSGMIIPVPLMPPSLKAIAWALPFHGMIDMPLRLWSGSIPAGRVWQALGIQLAWVVGLVICGRVLMRRALGRLVVQGG